MNIPPHFFDPRRSDDHRFRGHGGPSSESTDPSGRGGRDGFRRGFNSSRGRGNARFLGRGRGNAGPYGRGAYRQDTTYKFATSEDGTQFYFPQQWTGTNLSTHVKKAFKSNLRCIGGYSEDEDKTFSNDKTYLSVLNVNYLPDRTIKEKKVNFDLTVGEEEGKQYTGTPLQGLHNLLSWIISNPEIYAQEMKLGKEDDMSNDGKFVANKNVIYEILKTYNNGRDCFFYAVCIDGVIFLLKKSLQYLYDQSSSARIHIWSHKFEQYMTSGNSTDDGIESNWDYRCVLTSKVGQHKLIYSSAIDCINPDKYNGSMEDCSAVVFLKSLYDNPCKKDNFARFKVYEWYLDLLLTGAPEVVVGLRNKEGMLHTLKLYDENDLLQSGKEYWNFNEAFLFLDKLLSFVKSRTESAPSKVLSFKKDQRSLFFTSAEDEIQDFVPEWFLENVKSMK